LTANVHFFDSTVSLTYNIYLVAGTAGGYEHKLYVHKPGDTVTVNGDGRYIHCSREASSKLIRVSDDTTVKFTNVVLKDFQPKYFDLNTTGSVIFGDGTTIELAEDTQVDSSYTLSFEGGIIINGYGHEFDLSTGPGSYYAMELFSTATLTLENLRLTGLGSTANNLFCNHRFATLDIRNADLMLTGNYTFSEGFMNIYQDVTLKGKDHVFAYQSPRQGRVHSDGMLLIDKDVTFSYDAGDWNAYKVLAGRTLFDLEDASSILYLNGCTLHSTRTGLQLDQGTLVVDDKVTLTSEAIYEAEAMQLGSAVDIKVLGGANMNVYGLLKY